MNKNLLIGIVVGVLVLGGVMVVNNQLNNRSSNEAAMVEEDASMKRDDVMMEKQDGTMIQESSDSRYVEYTNSALEKAADKRRVLYFYASWCPTCRPADADFRTNLNKFPEDLVLIRVNYNDPDTDQEEKDLAKKYGITYQHTFVQIDAAGAEVKKWNGGQTEELLENIK